MIQALLALGVIYLCYAAGRQWLLLCGPEMSADEEVIFGSAIGLGFLAYAVLVLGVFGGLGTISLWSLVFVFFVVMIIDWRGHWKALGDVCQLWRIRFAGYDRIVLCLAALAFAAALAGALSPETANDSLSYHLHLPKLYLSSGHVGKIPYEVNSLFPMLMEMLYTFGLGIGGPVLAKFFHLFTGLIAAGAVISYGRKNARLEHAWWAAVFFFTTPGVINQLGTTYIDAALACYAILGWIAVVRWSEQGDAVWLFLAGMLFGFAMSVKYLALIPVGAAGLYMVWSLVRRRSRISVAAGTFLVFGIPLFIFSAYWYIRSYIELGNPVYPYFYSVFHAGDPTIQYDDIGVAKNFLQLALVPWTMTMRPDLFEGFGVQLGPGYLALLPLAAAAGGLFPSVPFLFFAAFYLVCWFFLGQSLRFFLPALPALAVFLARGFSFTEKNDWPARGVRLLIALVIFFNAGTAVYHYRHEMLHVWKLDSSEEYLRSFERSYPVAEYVNGSLPPTAKILNTDEVHMFYFRRSIVRESVYARETRYYEKGKTPEAILRVLKKDGFTHILLAGNGPDLAGTSGAALRVPEMLNNGENGLALFIDPIYTKRFTAKDGAETEYKLYQIKGLE